MQVTVIVVSRNQFEETCALLEHLKEFPVEVVLVDNASEGSDYTNTTWGVKTLHLELVSELDWCFSSGAYLAQSEYVVLMEPCDRMLPHRIIHQLDQIGNQSVHWVSSYHGHGEYDPSQIYESVKDSKLGMMINRQTFLSCNMNQLVGKTSRTPCVYRNLDMKPEEVNSERTGYVESTILILTQNRFQGLLKLLDSIPYDMDIIVINNGSTDLAYTNHTFDVGTLVHLPQPLDWTTVVKMGTELASGEYIILSDDRSELLPERLTQQIVQMQLDCNGFSCGEVVLNSPQGQLYNRGLHWDYLRSVLGLEDNFPTRWDLKLISTHNACIWFTVIISRSLLTYALTTSTDQWSLWKWVMHHTECTYITEPVVIHHQ